ncbi:MAG: phosphatase PAP2 family protein [Longimicrobiales bacterium]|nr:phosphatase PAP2 family protein [Longimicrobiales bacterium]
MSSRRLAATLLQILLAVAALPAGAQERPFPYSLGARDAVLLPVGAGLSLLGDLVASDPSPLTREQIAALSPDDINSFDRTAARSWSKAWGDRSDQSRDALLGAAVLVSFAPQVLGGRWKESVTLGVMFTEAFLLVEGATYTAKELAGRKRPWVYNTSLSVDERHALSQSRPRDVRRSFFSGHTSAAFTLATLMSTVYGDVYGRSAASDALWAASLSAAALTGYARVKAGQHYPSDVLVGAAVGSAVGILVPSLHRAARTSGVQVTAGPGGLSVRVPWGGGR